MVIEVIEAEIKSLFVCEKLKIQNIDADTFFQDVVVLSVPHPVSARRKVQIDTVFRRNFIYFKLYPDCVSFTTSLSFVTSFSTTIYL